MEFFFLLCRFILIVLRYFFFIFHKTQNPLNKYNILLLFLVPFVSIAAKKDINLSRIESAIQTRDQAAYSHCNCSGIKETRDCSPECFLYCSLKGAFVEARTVMDKKCMKSKKTVVAHEERGIFGLTSAYKKAGKKISKLEKNLKPLSIKEGCEHCSEVSKIMNLTQPYRFKEESCDSEFIKVHFYNKKITLSRRVPCTEEQQEELMEQLQEYGKHILRGGGDKDTKAKSEILNDNCPGDCSFYVNSVITLDQKVCSGKIDFIVNCHHKKASDYIVHISHYQQRQCSKQ